MNKISLNQINQLKKEAEKYKKNYEKKLKEKKEPIEIEEREEIAEEVSYWNGRIDSYNEIISILE